MHEDAWQKGERVSQVREHAYAMQMLGEAVFPEKIG